MTAIAVLVAVCVSLAFHWTNALLAILAFMLLELTLTVCRIREALTDLCRLLKDDEPSIEDTIRQIDAAVARMGAGTQTRVRDAAPGVVGWWQNESGTRQ